MITKEELEKLINNGDRVYFIKNKEIHSIGLDKNWCFIDNEYLKWSSAVNKLLGNEYHLLDDLYKSKDEAEFALEFGNITRTETLKLPTWEKFCEMVEKQMIDNMAQIDIAEFDNCLFRYISNKNSSCIGIEYGCRTLYFNREITPKTYTEACRIAKDLFLGKEPKG